MVNSTETTVLIEKKKLEGKSYEQIGKELKTLNQAGKVFSSQKREINTLINEINKRDIIIDKLREEKAKDKNKKLVQGLKDFVTEEKKNDVHASINNAKRIIKYMEVNKPYTKTDLKDELIIPTQVVEEIIDFLIKYTNIKIEVVNGKYIRHE